MKTTYRFALAAVALGGAPATAQTVTDGYGGMVYNTLRTCRPDLAICDGSGVPILLRQEEGGADMAPTSTFAPGGVGAGSSAFGSVAFGGLGLPQIRASIATNATSRIGNTIYAYQTYTYTGAEEFDLLLNGNFHIVDSSASPQGNGNLAGGVTGFAGFAVWDADDFFAYGTSDFGPGGFETARGILNRGFLFGSTSCADYADPDNGYLGRPRAMSSNGRGLTGGDQNIGIGQTNCGEETLTLYQGERFVIASYAQLTANRGGWADATGTFTIGLDPSVPADQQQAFAANIRFVAPGVPEPATWAMMIGGFALAGAAARRRRPVGATA